MTPSITILVCGASLFVTMIEALLDQHLELKIIHVPANIALLAGMLSDVQPDIALLEEGRETESVLWLLVRRGVPVWVVEPSLQQVSRVQLQQTPVRGADDLFQLLQLSASKGDGGICGADPKGLHIRVARHGAPVTDHILSPRAPANP